MALEQTTLSLGPLDNRSYLLWCTATRQAALIDIGFEPEVAIQAVQEQGLTLTLLLNTHGHFDHVSGMREVQEALGGEYWIHPADLPLIERLTQQGAAFGFPPAAAPSRVNPLTDGQQLTLGRETLEVIHTPGHSPGGVCFRHGNDLWVGDTLFAGSVGRTDLPGGSFEELARAIRTRLFPLGDARVCHPGHGPATTIGEERLHNPFVGEKARLA